MKRTTIAETPRAAERGAGVELSDADLEHVMGGLSRVWAPFPETHNDVASAVPLPHADHAAAVAGTALPL